jgi:spoIIIJ-associated protein
MSDPAGDGGDSAKPDLSAETEASGETVGEAKWAALRELEHRFPGLDKQSVEFVIISEGERGLLGVGFVPARVIARVVHAPPPTQPEARAVPSSEAALVLRDLLEHVRRALGLDASVSISEGDEALLAAFHGRDLGLVIGKHGQTIDAIQYLANSAVSRMAKERVDVVVDAAGYRDRRRATLEALADRTALRVTTTGASETLEPMSAAERKIVHLRLKDREDVITTSEGTEPNRHVVVSLGDSS